MKRIKTHLALLLGALLLCTALLPPALAMAQGHTHGVVRVGYFAMEGYHMQDERGARSGYGYDFLQLVARYSDLKFEYVGYDKSWDDMVAMLANGEIDILTPVHKTPEWERDFAFNATLIGTSADLLTVKAGDARYAGGNYNGMRVGLIAGDSGNERFADYMKAHGFAYTPVYFAGMNELTDALQAGTRIDAALSTGLRQTPNEWTLEELDSIPFYAMLRKDDTELMAELNAAIARMDVDSAGWRTMLKKRYYAVEQDDVVAFTAEERAYLEELRVFKVTVNPDCAPYSYFEDGRAKGVLPDIFAEVAKRMGIVYTMVQPADRAEYKRLVEEGAVDIILDAMDDFYTVESHGLEITDVYYTAPIAALTTGAGAVDTLAQVDVSIFNEADYADLFSGKTVNPLRYATMENAAHAVKRGDADASYMLYYCAQWLSEADVTGKLQCRMLSAHERPFTYAVRTDENYLLLSALNKAVGSLSEDFISGVVAADTAHPETGFSFTRFVYQNPLFAATLAAVFMAVVGFALFLADKSRREQKELRHGRQMERYIGYLCDMYYKVLEVDLTLHTRKQYMKRDGKVEIEERRDFTGFAIQNIHPEDVEECLAAFDPAAVRALAERAGEERYIECRMRAEDGSYRWYDFLLKAIPKDAEHPCSAALLIRDADALHREREQHHEELLRALSAANSASRSKSTFLSSMSHEIRTPLNAMIGYMTIAETAINDRDKVLHCIDSAGIAARHLLSIINDVLDISSMESGKMKLSRERFDLKEQLSALTSLFYQQSRQKNVEFTVSIEGLSEEWVLGDAMRVSQILMNLLSNAVKFTPAGGSISLVVAQTALNAEQVYLRFVVKDTGIGMSEEYMSRLFMPFEQESAQTARDYGGTGLGMSITYNLVTLMGGKMEAQSAQGAGSTFTVTLPFGRTENPKHTGLPRDFSRLHVLVVDDLENECDYVRALLTRCGVHAESAQGGEAAIRLARQRRDTPERFDLCIIDWNMPGLDGVETTRRIHEECDPDIPIIIATAYDISEFEERALAAGAARIISKPLFQSTLFDLLMTTYGKYDATPEAAEDIPDLSGMRVLLAEDNEMNIEVAVDILELAGIAVDTARNGEEALALFLEKGDAYDAILMDVQMPVMDGYAATRAIRAADRPNAKSLPIIAMTANAFAEDVSASLAAGMNGHLSKPIETPALFRALKELKRG